MENPAKKAKTSAVLPTSEEQRQLQQLEILMKNNLLNLQSKELIEQVDASSKLSGKKVTEFLSALDADVKDTSKTSCHKRVLTTEWVQQQAGYESLQFNAYEEVSMEYRSPSELLTTGSYATNTCISPFYNIDILVTIPSKLIDSRDVLNHVYFDKRSLFLAGLRKTLEKANKKNGEKYKAFSFEYLKGDVRKPVLSIVPSFSSSVVVRLIPVLPESCVKLVQLRPSKNNVRPRSWVEENQRRKERGIVADAKEMDVSKLPATPQYNAAILEDIVMPLHHQLLSRTIQSFDNIRGALMLLKVWLRQRQLVHSAIGFDTHTISLLLAYLVQTKRISTTAAPEIIFQTVLTFLTTFDAATNVLDFTGTAFVPRAQLPTEEKSYSTPQGFMLRHPVSLQPPTGDNPIVVMYNVFWRVHDSSMTLLKNEATKALQDLTGSHRPGAFDRMFLQKRGFQDSFDQIFMLQVPSWSEVLNKVMYSLDTDEEGGGQGGVASFAEQRKEAIETASLHWPVEAFFATETYSLLKKALGDRIIHLSVSVMPLSNASSSAGGSSSGSAASKQQQHEKDAKYPAFASPSECLFIVVGVLLDKEKHQRKVERGPPAVPASEVSCCGESPAERAVREFKDFWGDKAQLRRFKDGSILESVVWEDAEFSPLAHDLIENIARYIVSRHLQAAVGDVYAANGNDNDDDDDDDEHLLGAVSRQGNFWARMGHLSTTELLAAPLSANAQSSSSSRAAATAAVTAKTDLQIVTAYDELRNVLVNKLQRIPLRIDTLLAYSPELRYAALYPVEPHLYVQLKYLFSLDADAEYKPLIRQYVGCPFSLVTSPIPVIAKFEASSKWPTDPEAIRKCKTAFLLKVKDELWSQAQVLSIIHEDSLDVLVQGFIFRVYPMATFETERIALLNTAPSNLFLTDITPSHYAVNCRYVIPPLHHNAMKSLHAQHPIFGETVKLMRLWLARHQFSGHLCQEAIECLVATEFLHPSTSMAPTTTSAAFLRTLQLLVDFNWDEEPLIVDYSLIAGVLTDEEKAKMAMNPAAAAANLNAPLTTDVRTLIATRFRASKTAMESLPVLEMNPQQSIHPAMYIVTSVDKINEFEPMLKPFSPEKVVLNLMIQAAKVTLKRIHSEYLRPAIDEIPSSSTEEGDEDEDDNGAMAVVATAAVPTVEHLGHFFQSSTSVLKKCNVVLSFSDHLLAPERSVTVGGRRVRRLAKYNDEDDDEDDDEEEGGDDDDAEDDDAEDDDDDDDAGETESVVVGGVELTYRDVQAGPAFASTMLFANTGKNELDLSRLVVIANECRGHPVQAEVVQKLRHVFGPQALFFWDETDGAKVGILWRPRFTRPRPFAVMDCRYRTLLTKKSKKQNRKRKAADSDEESETSNDDDDEDDNADGDNGATEDAGDALMQPHFEEIIEHVLVVAKGLLQRDADE